jgi:hypothetical protein
MPWTRITDPDHAAELLPTWFSGRMIGERGAFGLLLTTGDIMRITSILAIATSDGLTFMDVLLDSAGVPEGVDMAWRQKHFLGAPVPGATLATVNVAHVIALVEFVAAELVDSPDDIAIPTDREGEIPAEYERLGRVPAPVIVS